MAVPTAGNRIRVDVGSRGSRRLEHLVEPGDPTGLVAHDLEALRLRFPVTLKHPGCGGPFVELRDLANRGGVHRACRLDDVEGRPVGKEGAAQDRILDDVEKVGRVPPEVRRARLAQLGGELPARSAAIVLVAARIRGAQGQRDRLTNEVVNVKAVALDLDERQFAETLERIVRLDVGQHRSEERHRRPSHDRCGVERAFRRRLRHILEIHACELFDDDVSGGRNRVRVGARPIRRGDCRESQCERVSRGEAIDSPGPAGLDAALLEKRQRVGLQEGPEGHVARESGMARRERPCRHGSIATGNHEAHVWWEPGKELPGEAMSRRRKTSYVSSVSTTREPIDPSR